MAQVRRDPEGPLLRRMRLESAQTVKRESSHVQFSRLLSVSASAKKKKKKFQIEVEVGLVWVGVTSWRVPRSSAEN